MEISKDIKHKVTLFAAFIVFISCNVGDKYKWRNRAVKHYEEFIPYNLLRPNESFKLEDDLIEISGLTHLGNEEIACVEDETGNIYILDDKNGKIKDKIKFFKFGDYEGITYINDVFFVVKSNGKIYKWKNNELIKLETDLGVENNVEGMCYDPLEDVILLSCKELPGIDERDFGDSRAIYAYDYKVDSFYSEPRYLIYQDSLMNYVQKTWSTGEQIPNILFKPSGIDINPIDNRIYIVNYIGRILIVLNRDGSFHAVLPLSVQLFPQPEGICFDKEGNMFISNEGGEEKGFILKFNIRSKN